MYFLMEKGVKLFGFILILLCLDHTKFQGGSYDGGKTYGVASLDFLSLRTEPHASSLEMT